MWRRKNMTFETALAEVRLVCVAVRFSSFLFFFFSQPVPASSHFLSNFSSGLGTSTCVHSTFLLTPLSARCKAREHTKVSVTKFDFWRTCQHSPLDCAIRVEFAWKRYNKSVCDNPSSSPFPEDRDKSEENADTSSVKLITPDLVVMIRPWK